MKVEINEKYNTYFSLEISKYATNKCVIFIDLTNCSESAAFKTADQGILEPRYYANIGFVRAMIWWLMQYFVYFLALIFVRFGLQVSSVVIVLVLINRAGQ